MGTTWETYNLNSVDDAKQIANELQRRWRELSIVPGILRYQLNIRKERVLEGHYGFLTQLNIERGNQRRIPIVMDTVKPPFQEKAFNFTKIKPGEKFLDIRFQDFSVAVLVNQSPITEFHSLLVPRINEKLPQVLTEEAIMFTIRLLRTFNSFEFQIGYNSPGAAASVNHLHLHLIHSTHGFFAQKAALQKLRTDIYRLNVKYEIKAVCFLMRRLTCEHDESETAERVYKLVGYMLENNIPHNVLFALVTHNNQPAIRILVYPRDQACVVKNTTELNIAFCELSGFVPIADEEIFNSMTERSVLDAIKMQQCDVFKKIQSKVMDPNFYQHKRAR